MEKFTTNPPVGAFADSVTVPVAEFAAVTARFADAEYPFASVPAIVAVLFAVTALVVTVNVAVLAPAATVSDAGTVANDWLETSFTTNPPVGALAVKVTVPVAVCPPVTLVGETVRVDTRIDGTFTVNVAEIESPPHLWR